MISRPPLDGPNVPPAPTMRESQIVPDPQHQQDPSPISVSVETLAWDALANTPVTSHSSVVQSTGHPFQPNPEANTLVGSTIGSYQLTALLRTTAFITSYQANHLDDPSRSVTLELLHLTVNPDSFLNHFHTDPAIRFAAAKHPNIPAPLEAGTIDGGQPYLVVEPVDGLPIDIYCDNLQLTLTERSKLFAQVCDVIHFAHRHTIIHRDLKPANILITFDGTPMIINYGIVNLFVSNANSPKLDDSLLDPEFTSPEQIIGDTLTTAVDIYSLGVILYSVLTGHLPYRVENSSRDDRLQVIVEQIAQKPSQATTHVLDRTDVAAMLPQQIAAARGATGIDELKQSLAGDLDSIVLMALRKEPGRRYTSADQFADDLRRYLAGLPVRAHRDSRAYRLVKFVRRHVALVVVGMVTLLTPLIALLVTSSALISTRQDRNQANAFSNDARHTIDNIYMHMSNVEVINQLSLKPLRNTLLDDTRHFYQTLLDQSPTRHTQPVELAEAAAHLARITTVLGPKTLAADQFDRARILWEDLIARSPANQEYQRKLAALLTDNSILLVSLAAKLDRAHQSVEHAHDLIKPLLAANPASIPLSHQLADIFLARSLILARQQHPDKAIASISDALSVNAELAAADPTNLETQFSIANAHAYAGFIYATQPAEQLEAINSYKQTIEIRQHILTGHPDFDEQSHRLALDQSSLADILQRSGQIDLALKTFRQSLEQFEQLNQRYPNLRPFQFGRAIALNAIAELLRRRNETADALLLAQNARALLRHLQDQYPQDASVRIQLAVSHNIIGRLLERSGLRPEALRSFQQSIDLYETIVPNLDPANIYNLACTVAICIPLIGEPEAIAIATKTPSSQSKTLERRRGFYADRAMQALRQAGRAGYLNSEMLDTNNDLDPLRHRPDFDQLLKDVQSQSIISKK